MTTAHSKLAVFWDAFMYGLRGGLVMDAFHDFRMWRRQRKACAFFSAEVERRIARANTPWAMLDREDARRLAYVWAKQHGVDPEGIIEVRPIYASAGWKYPF
jgi:hypothetical protein